MTPTATCCPSCGRRLRTKQPLAVATDTTTLTTAQLYAFYKQTSAMEDLKFLLRVGPLSAELRARAEAISTPTARDMTALRTAWRIERQAAELAASIPGIGSLAWADAQNAIAELVDLPAVA